MISAPDGSVPAISGETPHPHTGGGNSSAAVRLVAAAYACSGPASGGRVTILVSWGGPDVAAFGSVISKFEASSRIHVNIESTRGLTQQLNVDLSQDDPADGAR
jgi:hypothetical protein